MDHHYGSFAGLANGVAEALNAELRHLESLGVDLIQIDEPEVHFRYSACADMAVEAIDRALRGITTKTAIHMCYGYSKNIAEKRTSAVYGDALALLAATTTNAISLEFEQPGHDVGLLDRSADKQLILGVLNLDTEAPVETVEHIVGRSRDAAEVVGLDRLTLAPDCGMWFLPRETALGKITNMARAAAALSD